MTRIYFDKLTISLFILALILYFSGFAYSQSLATNSNLDTGPNLTPQEQKLMQEFASGGGSSSISSETQESKSQYTPVGGTEKLDLIESKENQTISRKTDKSASGSSVPGADEFVNTAEGDTKSPSKLPNTSIWQPLLSLFTVLAVIVIIAWLIKRFLPGQVSSGVSDVVQVLGRVPVDNKNSLCLAKFGNEILLLGTGPDGIRLVDKVSDPDKIASLLGKIESSRVNSISKSFAGAFKNARGDYLDDNLEDEEIIEEFDDDGSVTSQRDDELEGLLKKVRGLSKLKQDKREH